MKKIIVSAAIAFGLVLGAVAISYTAGQSLPVAHACEGTGC